MMSSNTNSLPQDYSKNLIVIQLCTNFLSVLGSSFIATMYFCNKDLQSFAYKLVLLLSISDMMQEIGRMFSLELMVNHDYTPDEDSSECIAQAFFVNCGGLATIASTTAISWSLAKSIINGKKNLEKYSIRYYSFIFGLPLVISVIPIITGDYGVSGMYCWIADNGVGSMRTLLWRLFLFYIPLWISVIYNFINYYRIYIFIQPLLNDNSEEQKQQRKMISNLMYYPLIMVICYFFATVNRIHQFFDDREIQSISYLHVALAGLQGFFNSLIYGLNKQIKNKLCGRCIKSKQDKDKQKNNQTQQNISQTVQNIHSVVTIENNSDRMSVQQEMRQNLGQDIYIEYDSYQQYKIEDMKGINYTTQLSETLYKTNTDFNQENLQDINLK